MRFPKRFFFSPAAPAAAFLLALSASALPVRASATLSQGPERNAPLIMENADHFEGYRSRGEYVLSGKVRFRHGELRVETERAVWQKERNIIFCESGMRITRKGSLLTADRGTYDKNLGQATAQGHVFMRDSSGEVAATGESIVYLRFRHLATLTGNPEVRRFYAAKPDSAAAKGDGDGDGPDTLSIKGEIMTYDDSLQVAIADGDVRIRREKLNITCKKAEYHDRTDSLYLLGDPQVVVDDNRVEGDIMRMGMHGEEIKSLLVKGSAQAHSVEPATDTSVARQSDVRGDSLFLAFKEKAIDSVQVFRNADGAYFDVDKPDFVNKMSGEYMVLRFNGKQVASANVLGGAKSTYYHFEKKLLKGRNDAQGDTIDFAFKDGRIEEVVVKGTAKGTYFGAKPGAAHGPAREGAEVDTASAIPDTAAAGSVPDRPEAVRAKPAEAVRPRNPQSGPAPGPAAPPAKAAGDPVPEKRRPNIPWRVK